MIGSSLRMNRIFSKGDGRAVIVAIDHGGIAGPVPGIVKPAEVLGDCVRAKADAILATRGLAQAAQGAWDRGTGLVLRLTGGFTVLGGGFEEELICDPETALRSGADAVAMTVKFGHKREGAFIRQASLAAAACSSWGLPVMIEAMAKQEGKKSNDPEGIRLAARCPGLDRLCRRGLWLPSPPFHPPWRISCSCEGSSLSSHLLSMPLEACRDASLAKTGFRCR